MFKICERKLVLTEPKYGILTLSKDDRLYFPEPGNIVQIYFNGYVGNGKMHSKGSTRIDGLTWLYNLAPELKEGSIISVYERDNIYVIKIKQLEE